MKQKSARTARAGTMTVGRQECAQMQNALRARKREETNQKAEKESALLSAFQCGKCEITIANLISAAQAAELMAKILLT